MNRHQQASIIESVATIAATTVYESASAQLWTLGESVTWRFEPTEAALFEPVLPGRGGYAIALPYHFEATCLIPDVKKLEQLPALLGLYIAPTLAAISEGLLNAHKTWMRRAGNNRPAVIVSRRLPDVVDADIILASSEISELGVRIFCPYSQDNRLFITVDVLCGVGLKAEPSREVADAPR